MYLNPNTNERIQLIGGPLDGLTLLVDGSPDGIVCSATPSVMPPCTWRIDNNPGALLSPLANPLAYSRVHGLVAPHPSTALFTFQGAAQ